MNNILVSGTSVSPGKIVCVGRNYAAHIEELGNEIPENMVLFLKPNSSVGDNLVNEAGGEILHYEGEISFLWGDRGFEAVAFGLDLTKRSLQTRLKEKGLPWERAKAFDGSALFSEFVPFDGDISSLSLELQINGETVQYGGVELMMYKPEQICTEVLSFMTLNRGDIVMTGTPKGVGPVERGDLFKGIIYEGDRILVEKSWKVPD